MLVEMVLNTEPTAVLVRLLGEGTRVFRPAKAVSMGPNIVRLLEPADYDPEDEDWEFKPGSVVRIEERVLTGGAAYIAVAGAEKP